MKKKICDLLLLCLVLGLVACAKVPTWQEQYDLGVRYLSEGNYQEAIIAFTAAIEIDPKQAVLYIGRADAYIGSGETEENLAAALADYEQAVELDETNADAWLGLADVYIRRGEFKRAIEVLDCALGIIGPNDQLSAKMNQLESGTISDADGKERLRSGYDANGNLNWYHTFEYNADRTTSKIRHFDATDTLVYVLECTYDEYGNALSGTNGYLIDSGELRPTEYIRDSNGELKSVHTYDYEDKLQETIVYEWNVEHNIRTTKTYGFDGELQAVSSTTFDQDENPLLLLWFNESGAETSRGVYKYDENGLLQSLTWYSPEGSVSSQWRYYYDANGKEIKMEQYDENGNIINSVFGE